MLRRDVSVVSDIWFGIQFPISVRKPCHDGCRPGRFGSQAGSGIRFREAVAGAAGAARHGKVQIDGNRWILPESHKKSTTLKTAVA
jgi:hypothetical protein